MDPILAWATGIGATLLLGLAGIWFTLRARKQHRTGTGIKIEDSRDVKFRRTQVSGFDTGIETKRSEDIGFDDTKLD